MSCDVKIIDDSKFEDSEEFIVQLEDASSGSRIGKYLQVYWMVSHKICNINF